LQDFDIDLIAAPTKTRQCLENRVINCLAAGFDRIHLFFASLWLG
jgi:hypothetical protein